MQKNNYIILTQLWWFTKIDHFKNQSSEKHYVLISKVSIDTIKEKMNIRYKNELSGSVKNARSQSLGLEKELKMKGREHNLHRKKSEQLQFLWNSYIDLC